MVGFNVAMSNIEQFGVTKKQRIDFRMTGAECIELN